MSSQKLLNVGKNNPRSSTGFHYASVNDQKLRDKETILMSLKTVLLKNVWKFKILEQSVNRIMIHSSQCLFSITVSNNRAPNNSIIQS